MDGTNFALAMSSLCLVLLFAPARDVPAQVVDGEDCTPLVDDSWTLVDILLSDLTLSIIKLRRTFVMDSSSVVRSLDIHTRER
jgi:hypothetical protein